MNASTRRWQAIVRQSQSEAALVAVVAEYLAGLPPEGVARLPESARFTEIRTEDDVVVLNVQVAREELMFSGDPATAKLLREMSAVLTEAASRLASMSTDARLLRTKP